MKIVSAATTPAEMRDEIAEYLAHVSIVLQSRAATTKGRKAFAQLEGAANAFKEAAFQIRNIELTASGGREGDK